MILNEEKAQRLSELHAINLERDIIKILSERLEMSPQEAMNYYYSSETAQMINQGLYGIQYLSPQYLSEEVINSYSRTPSTL